MGSESFLNISEGDFQLIIIGAGILIILIVAAKYRKGIFASIKYAMGWDSQNHAETREMMPMIVIPDYNLALRPTRISPNNIAYFDELERGLPLIEGETTLKISDKLYIYSRDPETGLWKLPKTLTYDKEKEKDNLEQIARLIAQNTLIKTELEDMEDTDDTKFKRKSKVFKEVSKNLAPTIINTSGNKSNYSRGDGD